MNDTFTFNELRVALTAFAMWLHVEVELVDRFIEETT